MVRITCCEGRCVGVGRTGKCTINVVAETCPISTGMGCLCPAFPSSGTSGGGEDGHCSSGELRFGPSVRRQLKHPSSPCTRLSDHQNFPEFVVSTGTIVVFCQLVILERSWPVSRKDRAYISARSHHVSHGPICGSSTALNPLSDACSRFLRS